MDIIIAIQNGFQQGIIFYPLVLGLSLSYRLLRFPDISVEGTFAFGGAMFASILIKTNSYPVAILAVIFSSAIAGSITALLHYYLRINKFLAGIILVTALYSITIRVLGGSNISLLKFNLTYPRQHLLFASASIAISAIAYFFYKSKFGIKVRAASLNPVLSRSSGHKTGLLIITGLALNNIIAAFSGVCFSLDAGFTDVKLGQGSLIMSLAALAIGERLVPRSTSSTALYIIFSAGVGSIAYQILWSFALQLNIQPSDIKILSAIIVVILFIIKRRNDADEEL